MKKATKRLSSNSQVDAARDKNRKNILKMNVYRQISKTRCLEKYCSCEKACHSMFTFFEHILTELFVKNRQFTTNI